jgi:hypothetical protein
MPEGEERPFEPLTEDELKSILGGEIQDALGEVATGSDYSNDRIRALRLYFGRPLGNEVPGRSAVVMTDVADTIHWILPSLMRMFDGEDLFVFEATTEKDIEAAKQATQFINLEFWNNMEGFEVLYEWFFTALLENTGIVLPYWDEKVEPHNTTFTGLTEREYNLLMGDPTRELEVVELQEREVKYGEETLKVFDCTVMEVKRSGRIRLKGVAPENFLISRRASRNNDDTDFVAERAKMTVSDLIAMGFDAETVKNLPSADSRVLTLETIERERREANGVKLDISRKDEAMKEHWIHNCWIRVDQDGDGYAEFRNIMCVGDNATEILSNDYADFNPFVTITPVPIPFRFVGQGISDLVGDLQIIRSTLFRQMLDNTYLINNSERVVVEGMVEIEDLLTRRPGGIIRAQDVNAVREVVQPPLPRDAYMMFDKLDEIRQVRTGVAAASAGAGADASAISKTATGANIAMQAANARVELIGRIFSQGVKRLGKNLLRLYKKHDNKARTINVAGQWVDIDPRSWPDSLEITVKQGLGVGAAAERIAALMAVLTLQKESVTMGASFLAKPRDLYNAANELTRAMGFRGAKTFFQDPGDMEWPPPPPEPKILEHERRKQEDQAKNLLDTMRLAADDREKQEIALYRQRELESKERIAQLDADTRIEVARIQANAKAEAAEERSEGSESGETDD